VLPKNTPLIIDLPDQIVEEDQIIRDFGRLFLNKNSFKDLVYIRFSNFILNMGIKQVSFICSSIEQSEIFRNHEYAITDILDSHSELPDLPFFYRKLPNNRVNIFWEGQATSLISLVDIMQQIKAQFNHKNIKLNIVSDPNFYLFANKFCQKSTSQYLASRFKDISFELFPWNIRNIEAAAKESNIFILPTLTKGRSHLLKPENRALISWRLGLPVLLSDSLAHQRLSQYIGAPILRNSFLDWYDGIVNLSLNDDLASQQVLQGKFYLQNYHNDEILLYKWDTHFQKIGFDL
jgi:hypothetical protein